MGNKVYVSHYHFINNCFHVRKFKTRSIWTWNDLVIIIKHGNFYLSRTAWRISNNFVAYNYSVAGWFDVEPKHFNRLWYFDKLPCVFHLGSLMFFSSFFNCLAYFLWCCSYINKYWYMGFHKKVLTHKFESIFFESILFANEYLLISIWIPVFIILVNVGHGILES